MSNSIDERIVQMQFDNKKFEDGVSKSLKTLEKLKGATDFKASKRSFEDLEDAAKRLNFSNLEHSVKSLTDRFSTLGIVGMTALQNITNKAVDAGERLIKSLSIDQVSAGWDKYADKTSAVQTIMAATAKDFSDTGEQMAYVNEQLGKLNWFTDETSYSFLDMVSNIGKFTSNAVALDTSVTAMQGISTWAAISGANVNEASRAMYNLAQAISVGSVKLIDWKSIENANMATAEFKETVIETALELGTLEKAADGTIKTLGKKGKEVSVTDFNSQLSEGWFTSDVLLKTLDKYGAFTDRLYEITEETGTTATEFLGYIDDYQNGVIDLELVAKKTGTDASKLAGYLEELTDETYALGLKSFKAAQEAKTFGEAISSVKDAVSTGWMNTFELIFGDYTEAKKLWTDLANSLWDIFAAGGEARNELLEGWRSIKRVKDAYDRSWNLDEYEINEYGQFVRNFSESIEELDGREVLIEGVTNAFSALLSIGSAVKYALRSIFPPMTAERLYQLTENFRDFTKNLKTYLSFNSDLVETADDQAAAYKGMSKPLEYLVRTLRGVFAAGKIVINTFKAISGAIWKFVWGNKSLLSPVGEFFANLGDKIVEFGENLDSTDWYNTKLGDLSSILNTLSDAADKGWARLQEFWNLLSTKFQESGIWPKIQAGFSKFTSYIQEKFPGAVETIGGFFSDILDWVEQSGLLDAAFQKISGAISWLSEKIPAAWQTVRGFFVGMWDYLQNNETLQSWVNAASDIWQGFVDKVAGFVQKIREVIASIFSNKSETSSRARDKEGAILGLEKEFDTAKLNPFEQFLAKLQKLRENFETNWRNIGDFFSDLKEKLSSGWSWVVGKFTDGSLLKGVKNIAIAVGAFFGAKTIWNFSNIGNRIRKGLEAIGEGLRNFGKGEQKIDGDTLGTTVLKIAGAIAVLAASVAVLTFMDPAKLERSFEIIKTLGVGFGIIAGSLGIISKVTSNSIGKIGKSILQMGLGLTALVGSIWLLSKINWDNFEDGINKLTAILIELAVFEIAVGRFAKGGSAGTDFLKLGAAVLILVASLKWLSYTPWDRMLRGALGLGLVLGELAIAFRIMSSKGFSGFKESPNFIKIGLGVLALVAGFKWLSTMDMASLGKGILAFTAIIGEISLMMLALKTASKNTISGSAIGSLTAAIIAIGAGFLIFYEGAKALKDFDGGDLLKKMTAFTLLVGSVGTLSALLGNLDPATAATGALNLDVILGIMSAFGLFVAGVSDLLGLFGVDVEGQLKKFGDIMEALGGAFGKLAGGFVGGALEGASNYLPDVGTNLSTFAENSAGFFSALSTLGSDATDAVNNFKTIMTTLGMKSVINAVNNVDSIKDFGPALGTLGENVASFATSISSLSDDAVTKTETMAGIISTLATSIPEEEYDAKAGLIESSAALFGEDLNKIGAGAVSFAESVEGLSDDAITKAETMSSVISAIAENIPEQSTFDKIFNLESNASIFGKDLETIGTGLQKYATAIDGIDADSVQASLDAMGLLKTFEQNLDTSGGFWSFLIGEKDIGSFGNKVGEFGDGLAKFGAALKGDDIQNVDAVISAVESLVSLAKDNQDVEFGWLGLIASELEMVAGDAFKSFVAPFSDPDGEMKGFGSGSIDNFIAGVSDKGTDLVTISGAVAKTVEGQIKPVEGKLKTIGQNAIAGYLNGLKSRLNEVRSVASQIASVTSGVTANTLKIKSPSRVMYGLGSYVIEGYTNALKDGLASVSNISQDLGDESILSLQDALSQLNSLIEDGVDVQPTITPIFDMSNLGDAAKAVDNAFYSGDYGLNVASIPTIQRTVQSVANSNSPINQLYNISDILEAVDKLGREIKGLKIVLDTGATVGGLSSAIDQKLGQRAVYRSRGN